MIRSEETRCGGRHLKIQDLTNPFWKETLTGNPTSKVITENKPDEQFYVRVFMYVQATFCYKFWQFTQRLTCKCVYLCVYMLSQLKDYVRSWITVGSVLCLCTPVSQSVPEM